MIDILHGQTKIASFVKDNNRFIIDYENFDIQNSISLSLPNTQKIYLYFKIGKIMLDSWKFSLEEKTMKEVDIDTIRAWKNY